MDGFVEIAGVTPLMKHAYNGRRRDVRTWLRRRGVDVNATDSEGDTVLFYAIAGGCFNTFLIVWNHSGVDKTVVNKQGRDALMTAVVNGRSKKIVEFLLEQPETDLTMVDNERNTALHCAAIGGNTEICSLLFSCCDPQQRTATNQEGNTPLHIFFYGC